jgi:TatD DNase family protein
VNPFLVDTHCHLHFPPYDEDREAVLLRMREKNIIGITIGTALENSERGIAFAEAEEGIWATVGLHPEHVTSHHLDPAEGSVRESSVDGERLRRLARSSPKVVAIGETGLDYYRMDEGQGEQGKRAQEKEFLAHVQVAQELDLPVVIHCRDALTRLAELIQDEATAGRSVTGVVHSFTGTWDEAKPLLDLGLSIAVNGIATFPLRKTQNPETAINRTIERIPSDRLLLETDAPYLAPAPYRGKRNEPAWVEEVAKHVAQVRRMSLDEVARMTTENATRLFKLV